MPSNSACDVIGLVTFVGRVERVKSKGTKGKICSRYLWLENLSKAADFHLSFWRSTLFPFLAPEKHWTYRWIHAVDGTSDRPFILEVFSSSQPEVFNRICPSRSTASAPIQNALLPHSFLFKHLFDTTSSLSQWPTWCALRWEFVTWKARRPTSPAAARQRRSSQVSTAETVSRVAKGLKLSCRSQETFHGKVSLGI